MKVMTILIVLIKLYFTYEEIINSFTDITKINKPFKILDVYFTNTDYTLLTKESIYKFQYNQDDFSSSYNFPQSTTILDYSSVIKKDSYYAVSCFNYTISDDNTKFVFAGIFSVSGDSLTLESYYSNDLLKTENACSISSSSNELYVGIVGANEFSAIKLTLTESRISNSNADTDIISQNFFNENEAEKMIRCIAEGYNKVLCLMFDSNRVFYFEGNFENREKTADKNHFIEVYDEDGSKEFQYENMRVSQCGENSYIIAAIKVADHNVQYFTPFTVGGGSYIQGTPTLILEGIPDTSFTYSGAIISNDLKNFYGVYIDTDNYLNVERVKYEGESRTINIAYDITIYENENAINTFTTINNNIIHIIVRFPNNIILYRFNYPGLISCAPNVYVRINSGDASFNVVEELNIQYNRIQAGFYMGDLNGIATVEDNTNYIGKISDVTKNEYHNKKDKESLFYLTDEGNGITYYSHDCTALYKVCHDFCKECSTLPSTKKYSENPSQCAPEQCEEGYAYLSNETSNCFSKSLEHLDGYILDGNIYEKCDESCDNCIAKPTNTQMNCEACKSGYTPYNDASNGLYCLICPGASEGKWKFDLSDITICHYDRFEDCPSVAPYYITELTKCVNQCPTGKFIDDSLCVDECTHHIYNNNKCVDICPSSAPYTEDSNKNCLTKCPSNKFTSGYSCVETCPKKSLDNEICVDECPENSEETETNKCECQYGHSFNEDGTIQCDDISNAEDYIVTLGNTCINDLISSGQITSENEIIIDKKIIIREGEIINQLEYKVKKVDGTQLDISTCKNITLTSPINIDYNGLDLNKIKVTSEKGYDILNPKDDFFNDICTKYEDENGADVPIKVRRQEYYQEFPLCESDCEYLKYNTDKNTVDCLCSYKEFSISTERTYSVIKTDSDFRKGDISNSNFKTMSCGKEAFKNLESNSGFWIILIGFLIQIGCFGMFNVFKTKIIGILLHDAFQITLVSNPKNKTEKKDETIIGDENNQIHHEDAKSNDIIAYNNIGKVSNDEINEEDKMTHEGLNNMNYENALLYDDRTFFAYFWNIFIYNQMLLFMIFKDNWNFVITKISMFVNIITFALLFNLMFFGNKLIEEIYKNKGGLTMNKAFGWIVLAVVLTIILNSIAKYFGLTKRDVDEAKKNKENFDDEKFSSLVFKRTFIYFIVILIITLFIWYFGISFCGIYRDCQKKLVFYIFMTWLLIMLYPILLCGVVALCRYLGLKKQIKGLFTFSKGIQWIIML